MYKSVLKKTLCFILAVSLFSTSFFYSFRRSEVEVAAAATGVLPIDLFLALLAACGYYSANEESAEGFFDSWSSWLSDTSNSLVSNSIGNQVTEYTVYGQLASLGMDADTASAYTSYCLDLIEIMNLAAFFQRDMSGYYEDWHIFSTDDGYNAYLKFDVDADGNNDYKLKLSYKKQPFLSGLFCSALVDLSIYDISAGDSDDDSVLSSIASSSFNTLKLLLAHIKAWVSSTLYKVKGNVLSENQVEIKEDYKVDSYSSSYLNFMESLFAVNPSLYCTYEPLNSFGYWNNFYSISKSKFSSYTESYLKENLIDLIGYSDFPSEFISFYKVSPSRYYYFYLYISEDLTGFSIYSDGSKFYKIDSDGNSSLVRFFNIAFSSNSSSDWVFCASENNSYSFSLVYPFMNYNIVSSTQYLFIPNFDLNRFYSSYNDYVKGIPYNQKALAESGSLLIGNSAYASEDIENVYVGENHPLASIEQGSVLDQALVDAKIAALAAAYEANLKTLQEAIESGNVQNYSMLSRILNSILELPESIVSGVSGDLLKILSGLSAANSYLGSIDTSIGENVAVLGGISGTLDGIDEKLGNIGLLEDINTALGDIVERLPEDIAGSSSTSIPVTTVVDDEGVESEAVPVSIVGSGAIEVVESMSTVDPDNITNKGIFDLLYYGILILIKLFWIFFHCYCLIFTLGSVEAYPYFLNDTIITGFNWLKEINITGDLLDLSLYSFLMILVRIILLFAIIGAVRRLVHKHCD